MSIEFTPEQQAEVARQVAEARSAVAKQYDAEAHKFREWINTHSALWAAQRFGTIGVIVGGLATHYISGLVRAITG